MARGAHAHMGKGEVSFATPWDADFIAKIKDIPWQYREWEKDQKVWIVHEPYIVRALNIFYDCFPYGTRHEYVPPAPPPPPAQDQLPPPDSAWGVLWVMPGAPPEVIKAAYRAQAKRFHPDMFPSPEAKAKATLAMQRINWALEQLVDEDSK